MKNIDEAKKIIEDFKNRQEELWYMRDEFVTSTIKELEGYMPLQDDGSAQYIEVMATYEALKDEREGIAYAYLR